MITKELIEYIKAQHSMGKSEEDIKQNLLNGGGWSASDIQEALVALGTSTSQPPNSLQPKIPIQNIQSGTIQSNKISQNAPASAGSSRKKGLLIAVLIFIILLGAVGAYAYWAGYFPFSKTPTPEKVLIPIDSTKESNPQDVTVKTPAPVQPELDVNDLWPIFDKVNLALKNMDVASYNTYTYTQVTPEQLSQFSQIASSLYSQSSTLDKNNYVNKFQDDKQAIYSTNPEKVDNAEEYRYTQGIIMFIKKDGSWKILSESPERGWSVLKKGTNKTATQIEKDLQAMLLDSDKDGLTNMDELCEGAQMGNSKCVKTDPKNMDTNGNGWWDGIEANMK